MWVEDILLGMDILCPGYLLESPLQSECTQYPHGRRGGIVVEHRIPDREVGLKSSLGWPCCILEQDTLTSQKVLVIPRKQWLHPSMTENLLTGT